MQLRPPTYWQAAGRTRPAATEETPTSHPHLTLRDPRGQLDTFLDFYKVVNEGVRPDGRKLDPLMPLATLHAMNDTEKRPLWLYLRAIPARPFGQR